MREAYRLQKDDLTKVLRQKHRKAFLFFIYTDKTIPSFSSIKESMSKCLKRLEKLAEQNEIPS